MNRKPCVLTPQINPLSGETRVQGLEPPSDSEWTSNGMEASESAAPVAIRERLVSRTMRFSVRTQPESS